MTDNDWIKQLQSMMERHEEAIPDGLWQDIESRLPERQAPRRQMPAWGRYAAAAVAAAVIGVGGLLWHGGSNTANEANETPAITMTSPKTSTHEPEALAQNDATSPDVVAPAFSPSFAQVVPVNDSKASSNASVPNEHFAIADNPTEAAPVQATNENEPDQQLEKKAKQPVEQPDMGHINVTSNSNAAGQIIVMPAHKKKNVSLDFYASNAIQHERSYHGDMTYQLFSQLSDEPILFDSITIAEYYHSYIKHHAPYSFGVSVRLPLNDRLALISGLVYTRLKSDLSGHKEQILHYVGVPLGVTYSVWRYKRLSVYAIGGIQADFNIKATIKKPSQASAVSIGKDRVQFSGMLGPGFQFDITKDFGIYVEPTARYYFNNGSDIKNYFKDKPWNINLNAGLRLSLE